MSKYKMIALDLDGTLLKNSQEVSDTNRHWIKKAEEAGLIVSFATGRGRSSSEQFWDAVRPTSPMIMANGAEVWKNHQELLSRHFLPPGYVPKLQTLAAKYDAWYWAHASDDLLDKETWDQAYLVEREWLKFGMIHKDPTILGKLKGLVGSLGDLEVSSSAPNNIEINPRGISKASGLAEVALILGIQPSEVVVMGDSLNDMEMIKWAGFGVAMQNAEDAIKEAADHITGSNEEDGVARVIQLILK